MTEGCNSLLLKHSWTFDQDNYRTQSGQQHCHQDISECCISSKYYLWSRPVTKTLQSTATAHVSSNLQNNALLKTGLVVETKLQSTATTGDNIMGPVVETILQSTATTQDNMDRTSCGDNITEYCHHSRQHGQDQLWRQYYRVLPPLQTTLTGPVVGDKITQYFDHSRQHSLSSRHTEHSNSSSHHDPLSVQIFRSTSPTKPQLLTR